MPGTNGPARHSFLAFVLLLVATPATAQLPTPPPDFKVAFWYLRADPLTSIRSQVYDVRKGEYTPAVDQWLATMRQRHPEYEAYTKEVRLRPQSGESEKKQVARVILQEYVEKGGPNGGYGARSPGGIYGGASLERMVHPGGVPATREAPRLPGANIYMRGYGTLATPGTNRQPSFLNPGVPTARGIPTPFPYPYVRPHP